MIYLSFFFSITLFILALFKLIMKRPESKKTRRIKRLLNSMELENGEQEELVKNSLFQRILNPVLQKYKQNLKQRLPGEKVAKLEKMLLQAGTPFNLTAVELRLIQLLLSIGLATVLGIYGMLKGQLNSAILFGAIGFIFGLIIPNLYLKQKAKKRCKQALKELPDTVDLLSVSLEAGLGFDAALSKIVEKKDGVLGDEFSRCLEEMRLGKTRREALTGVKERLVFQEINGLISNILQAEKLGIGMVQVLRIQSEDVRERRKQRAEEQAMKAPIKMLFPLVLFIFPSLFIVLLGPALIQIVEVFGSR